MARGHGKYTTSGQKPSNKRGKARVKHGSGTPKARPGKGGFNSAGGVGGSGNGHMKGLC